MKKDLTDIQKHSAGAIVTHRGKFESLLAYSNEVDITQDFRDNWVIPFYMDLSRRDDDWIQKIGQIKSEITDDIILQNLGDFNWRTRSTGSFFATIKNKKEYIEIIGTHLLKSEVCYAGNEYSIALCYFNTKESIQFLNEYLDYYLLHPELYFDQGAVISSIKYLDQINNTGHLSIHLKNWETMLFERKKIEARQHEALLNSLEIPEEVKTKLAEIKIDDQINLDIRIDGIEKRIEVIRKIQDL